LAFGLALIFLHFSGCIQTLISTQKAPTHTRTEYKVGFPARQAEKVATRQIAHTPRMPANKGSGTFAA